MSTLTTSDTPAYRGQKIALVVGYLALAGAVLYAYGAPAEGYEISIYTTATPIGFWLGFAVAITIAIAVTLYAPEGYLSLGGLALGGGAVLALAGLPIIRNYFFYGTGDAMTHLGWTRDLFGGVLSAFGLFYPGIHTTSLFMKGVVGTTIPRAMLLVVLAYILSFVVFVPLCVRSMTSHRGAMLLSGLAAFLLLPINHLGMNYMTPHPITDAVLLSPVVIYFLINYLTSPADVFESRYPVPALTALFAVVLGASVLYHPQQAANLIILFITISGVQFIYRSVRPDSRIAGHKTLYGPTMFVIGSFMLWSVGRGRYENSVDAVLRELLSFLTGGASAGAAVASRGNSLTAIGASVVEVFLKLFSVSAIFAALAGLLMLTSLAGRLRDTPDTAALVKYFTVGLVVLIPYSFVFFVGSVSKLFFRNVGLIMVFSTILGSIALYRYVSGLSEFVPEGWVRGTVAIGLVVMVALSAIVVFPSPYIYQPNQQVTESQMDGYDYAFDHQAEGVAMYGLRSGPWRFSHGVEGVTNNPIQENGRGIPEANISDIAGQTEEGRYLALTDATRQRESEVYRGLRYSQANLSTLDSQPGVHLVQSNGEFDLYFIAGSQSNATNATVARTAGG
ncbi:hypothetical protein [Halococcus saccharolyticus]|uniref:Uncharacterized protein n=1 Tax=Halococcus saccharolyticus DSM 5350 TaxID=1227455 RepID=M0MI00_9EURY|nr:hypothetical protein [Halococcus saccharolyticus]EMA45331.1 hypothetical protein C449_06890 [Halococcus saccharolyticus DSM 5350]